jgi:uncharacterized protein (DUF58 family)
MVTVISSLLAFSAVHNNDRVGAVFFSDRIEKWVPPRKGKKQVFRLVEDMMHLRPEGRGSDLALAIRTVYESLTRRGICVIISDFRVHPSWREMSLLSKKHDVIAVRLSDPSEKILPFTGLVQLRDPETGARITVPGGSRAYRKAYRSFWEAYHLFWERECRRRRVDTLSISTNDDPVLKLMHYFQGRKKRR